MNNDHIISDPLILNGNPIIKGTRISVALILEWIANGSTVEDIINEYPQLSREAILETINPVIAHLKKVEQDMISPLFTEFLMKSCKSNQEKMNIVNFSLLLRSRIEQIELTTGITNINDIKNVAQRLSEKWASPVGIYE